MVWDPKHELMPREKLERLKLRRLRRSLERAYEKVPFYREALKGERIKPKDIRGLDDLKALPFTSKDDLRKNYPLGMLAVPLREVVRLHASSGTTGKPTVVGYTAADIDLWAGLMARVLSCGEVTSRDVVHNAYGYGLFTGGLGFHYGGELLGATVIPVSGGFTERQLLLMQDLGSTVLCCTPSYALYLAEEAEERGISFRKLKLRVGFFGAEPWSSQLKAQVERKLGLAALDIYGLSEAIGPGVSCECLERKGLHIFEDHFIPEVIDPVTGDALPPGQMGELVLSCVTKEALPLFRFRTRDITRLIEDECPCGRTLVRMERVQGRTDDMLIIRGINLFPSQVEQVLMDFKEVEPHYLLVVRRERALDELEVKVEGKRKLMAGGAQAIRELEGRIQQSIHSLIGLAAKVSLVEPKTIERSMGKARRVLDERPKG